MSNKRNNKPIYVASGILVTGGMALLKLVGWVSYKVVTTFLTMP